MGCVTSKEQKRRSKVKDAPVYSKEGLDEGKVVESSGKSEERSGRSGTFRDSHLSRYKPVRGDDDIEITAEEAGLEGWSRRMASGLASRTRAPERQECAPVALAPMSLSSPPSLPSPTSTPAQSSLAFGDLKARQTELYVCTKQNPLFEPTLWITHPPQKSGHIQNGGACLQQRGPQDPNVYNAAFAPDPSAWKRMNQDEQAVYFYNNPNPHTAAGRHS
jgi:hypothetical protein